MSTFGNFAARTAHRNSLKTNGVNLASRLQFRPSSFQEIVVIVFVLLAALVVLVAVTFISSIDLSNTRRR
jgi:hypothetical protein